MRQKGEHVIYMLVGGREKRQSSAVRLRLCIAFNNLKQLPENSLLRKSYDMEKVENTVSYCGKKRNRYRYFRPERDNIEY